MANITNTPVWVIDTASASNLIALGDRRTVRSIRWVGCTASGHSASVTDGNGTVVFASTSPKASFVDTGPTNRLMDGLAVPTLDSGKLYIEF